MSERIIKRNFDLSAAFLKYSLVHPEVSEKISIGGHLIFEDAADPELNRANRKLIRGVLREGKKCFRAIKDGRTWKVERVTASV